ncbi:SKA complex subunit 1-like [Chironomus tepperi]|uniref:SKA complex subunit 1-like n=1 Tax=Chironomus tepperi TaxID=113505 RepID=UPI00391EFD94
MDFTNLFNNLTIKADNLELAMDILPHKDTLFSSKIKELDEDVKELKNLELLLKEAIKQQNKHIKDEYSEVKGIIENVNEKMLFLLTEIDKIEPEKKTVHNPFTELNSPAPKLFDRLQANPAFSELNTPRMSIDQYAKSPFAKKKNSTKLQLKFSDFEAEITAEQFDKIPSYIRGRIPLHDLQNFLDEIVIKCFNSKYELYYKNRTCLKPSDYNLQLFYKEQASYFEGHKFITLGDLARIMGKNVDKKDEKFLQCLRFLHLIKEARKNSATCYIWIEK